MPENITVNQAIWRARIRLNILPLIVSVGVVCLSIYLVKGLGYKSWLIGVVCGVGLPAIMWCRDTMSARWYIWALNNVRNVHELRQRAIFARVLSRTTEQSALNPKRSTELILSLKLKFNTPDEYADDPDIPAETVIYLARTKRVLMLIVMSICFIAGVTLIAIAHSYIVGSIVCAVSGYIIYDSYKSLSDSSPQITISNEGMTTNTTGFHSWNTIKNEFVGIEGQTDKVSLMDMDWERQYRIRNRMTTYYLGYDYDDQHEDYPLYDLRINHWKMAKLLRVYRARSSAI